ncbi:hypothetical protein [Flavobacterium sp. NKUCC04_CG]|uniref:hypothetical protein n=1 Tax=Flavobacterium sp. NKUCC04_CG TaxID=2842121 RepID=UPI001C5BB961|nr:hypothetical protein [Flavobacterium sp. NKUCC04_CG]MBW3518284.1 hypothetical protein [Flavobacterium sp. NKUCC04_CG]
MKIIKIFALIAITSLLAVGCSSDDSSPIIPPGPGPENPTQKELDAKFPVIGTYEYAHAGMKIPYVFTATTLVVQNSNMSGEDTEEVVVKAFQNLSDNVYKIVTKETSTGQYTAFFLRNITAESLEINMDYTFATEKEAIDTKYADPNEVPNVGHTKFGWLKLTKASIASISLPVSGKYIFDGTAQSGGVYSYNFTNEKVSFDAGAPYDMKVLAYNQTTKKILLEGLDSKAGTYYVAQLKDITDTSVKVARETKAPAGGNNPKTEAEAVFNSPADVTGNFTEYFKEGVIRLPVQGKYSFDGTSQNAGIYSYIFSNEVVTFDAGAAYDMKILKYNPVTKKILLEGLGSKAGTYYVAQLKNVTATSVKIGRETKAPVEGSNPKTEAEAVYNSAADIAGNFTEYVKQ